MTNNTELILPTDPSKTEDDSKKPPSPSPPFNSLAI